MSLSRKCHASPFTPTSRPPVHLDPYSTFQIIFILHWYKSLLTHPPSYKIGDSFFQLPLADAQAMLETSTAQIDADVSKLEDSLGELRDELQQLKVSLYARFGRSINLET